MRVSENSDDVDSRDTLKDEQIYAKFFVSGKDSVVQDCLWMTLFLFLSLPLMMLPSPNSLFLVP